MPPGSPTLSHPQTTAWLPSLAKFIFSPFSPNVESGPGQATCSCSFPTICVRLDNSVDFFGINRMPARSCWITNISQSVGLHVSETPRAMLAGDLFPGAATHARHVEGYGRGLTKRDPLVFHVGGWIKN